MRCLTSKAIPFGKVSSAVLAFTAATLACLPTTAAAAPMTIAPSRTD